MRNLALTAAALLAIPAIASAQTYVPRFESPREYQFVTSPVTFKINVESYGGADFVVDRSQACSPAGSCYNQSPTINVPGTGHCHIYIESEGARGQTSAFSAACETTPGNPSEVIFDIELPRGGHCAYVDLTENDHRSLVKSGPQALPPVDSVCFRVLGTRANLRKHLFGR